MKKFLGLGMKVRGYPDERWRKIAEAAEVRRYSAIESFCGPGGLSLGLSWAGFDVPYAFDYDERSVQTHQKNLPGKCEVLDARKAKGAKLIATAGLKKGKVDLFAGGPPCQGFSKQKRGAHLGDERNDLVLEYLRLVEEIKPRYFLFENVAIFGQTRGKKYLQEMIARLSDYECSPSFHNSADFGVPQTRERFILIGRRKDQAGRVELPRRTVNQWLTVGDVLDGLVEPPLDCSEHPKIANHQRARVTAVNIARFSHVPQGGGWQDIPDELRLPCHKGVDTTSGGWTDVYGRLRWDGQCPTITGGFDSFTRGRYGHPLQDRPLTPREAARIQGFPDNFVFVGNRGDVRSQIGNVVPPPLAEVVGLAILRALLISDKLIDSGPARSINKKKSVAFEEACC